MRAMQSPRTIWRIITGIIFIAAGLNHFRNPRMYEAIMPPYLPWHGPLVAISGYAEVALGVLACISRTKRLAGWGIIALLAVVSPANLHMALHKEQFSMFPAWALWARLPLQPLFMVWVYWCTHDNALRQSKSHDETAVL